MKSRSAATNNYLADTVRGANQILFSDDTSNQLNFTNVITAFSSTGFTAGDTIGTQNMASWTFRKQPKFFDVVTWTGNGDVITVNHNLGSVPGCIIAKAFSSSPTVGQNWLVYHRSVENLGRLNSTDAFIYGGISNVTSTSFQPSGTGSGYNVSGVQYIGYVFAHDAGGFGLTGTDNVISCGSYTGNGSTSGPVVDLGYEPQFIITKCATQTRQWTTLDTMRGMSYAPSQYLQPNSSAAEGGASSSFITPTATGFQVTSDNYDVNYPSETFIYIAIRRGPMKVPTDGNKVFSPNLETSADGTGTKLTTNFPVDLQIMNYTPGTSSNSGFLDRLRGIATTTTESGQRLISSATSAEASASVTRYWDNTGFQVSSAFNNSRTIYWNFRRAPSFFDEVCYTGTYPTVSTQTHNLGVAPELMIIKNRSGTSQWSVYSLAWLNSLGLKNRYGVLNATDSLYATDTDIWNNTLATAASFQVNAIATNENGSNFVAYLFATCAGVSKCGLYTGTGTTLQIDCGFTGGARFVMIKRANSTGDWYVWDSARGIVAGNDPYLLLNSTAAEVTSTDYVDTYSAGFEITSTAPAAINASGGTFIFLAIA